MRRRLVFPVALLGLLVAFPVLAQRGEERGENPPRTNQGRVPPPPPRRDNPCSQPVAFRARCGHLRDAGLSGTIGRKFCPAQNQSAVQKANSSPQTSPFAADSSAEEW